MQGGLGGAETFAKSEKLVDMLKKQRESSKPYGAMCASPALVLEPHGLLQVRDILMLFDFESKTILKQVNITSSTVICTLPWFIRIKKATT